MKALKLIGEYILSALAIAFMLFLLFGFQHTDHRPVEGEDCPRALCP